MSNNFQVEAIKKKRINSKGVVEYLVKWKKNEESGSTWEPVNRFRDQTMIENFERQRRLKDSQQTNSHGLAINKQQLLNYREESRLTKSLNQAEEERREIADFSTKTSSIEAPFLKILGLHVDVNGHYWFNILNNGSRLTLSREETIRLNFMAVIEFYESNIRFNKK